MPGQGGPHPNKETLSAFADRELPPAERVRVERHLHDCPDCRAIVAGYRGTSDLFQRIPAIRPPMSMNREMWRKIAAADERHERLRWLPSPLRNPNAMGLAVAVLLMLAVLPQVSTLLTAFSARRAPETRLAAPTVADPALPTPAVPSPMPTQPPEVPAVASPAPEATAKEQPSASVPAATSTAVPATPTTRATGGGQAAPATPTRTAQAAAPTARPTNPPPTATAVPLQMRTVTGQVAAVNRTSTQRTLGVTDVNNKTYQFAVSEGTLFARVSGQHVGFEDVGIGDQVEVTGFETQPAATPTTLMASQVKVLASAGAQAKQGPRVLVLLDGAEGLRTPQYGFTGDWIKRLNDTGYAVSALDPSRITGAASLKDVALVVIGYPATLSETAIQAVKGSKLPILVGDPRLVQPLGLGTNVDPAQPTRMVAGKAVDVAGQASPVTRGYNGETALANDTLYRTPIIPNGVTLGSMQDGGRKLTVWSLTGNAMYFGFWWSNSGANHNAAYWTLFDRSVLLLLGRDPLGPTPAPTPAAQR